jgi:hypothetical protein
MKFPCALALVSAIILALSAIPASAQPFNRTWVSNAGTDGGSCGPIATPCASFNGALANTATGGEIDCLTPGDFGGSAHSATITQSVSIVCDGVSNGGIIANSLGDAISVNAGSGGVVYLSNLDINGLQNGADGLVVHSASAVYVIHCSIRSFLDGVIVNSPTNPTRVVIKDSIIINNGTGVLTEPSGAETNATILINTVVDGSTNFAVQGIGNGGTSATALLQILLTGSPTGLDLTSGATAELIGPSNTIAGAITGTTTSVPFK